MGEHGSEREARGATSDAPEPTHSEARPRSPESTEPRGERRVSVRPSAFGLPRTSSARRGEEAHAVAPAPRLPNQRAHSLEQLVVYENAPPIALDARAAVEPNRAPLAAIAPRGGSARSTRRPWLSVAVFSCMVALSVVPLLRYARNDNERSSQPGLRVRAPSDAPAPVRIANAAAQSGPRDSEPPPKAPEGRSREEAMTALLKEATLALEAGDIDRAEREFARVLEHAPDEPHAAYGLARLRLLQNNLSGAEGWIQLALRKRPRRASYHALYGQVLMRMGRTYEAREEQALARPEQDDGNEPPAPAR